MPYSVCYRSLYAALLAVGLANTTGCLVTRVKWVEPDYVTTRIGYFGTGDEWEAVEQLYATALEQEKECLESCVDLFYEVALATSDHQSSGCSCRQCLLHKTALNKLIITGQQFGRLDPRSGLLIRRGGREECIPIRHRGFVWQPSDFHTLVPVGNYKTNGLRTLHRRKAK